MTPMWDHVAQMLRENGKKGQTFFITRSVTLAAAEEKPITFDLGETATFIWCGGLYTSDVAAVMAGTDVVHGGALVDVRNPAGKTPMMNGEFAPIGTLFGRPGVAGEGVQALPLPFTMEGKTIDMRIKNTVAGAQTLYLVLVGVKVS